MAFSSSEELLIPEHWLSAIINGDETSFDYYGDEGDYLAYRQFSEEMIRDGVVMLQDDESKLAHYHDATPYGVLPCDCVSCLICWP